MTDRLIAAAARIRECAEAATPGPWRADAEMVKKTGEGVTLRFVAEVFGLADKWPNAQYIAAMNPRVGLKLAALLDTIKHLDCGPTVPELAYEVADEILREPAEVPS